MNNLIGWMIEAPIWQLQLVLAIGWAGLVWYLYHEATRKIRPKVGEDETPLEETEPTQPPRILRMLDLQRLGTSGGNGARSYYIQGASPTSEIHLVKPSTLMWAVQRRKGLHRNSQP